MLKEKIQNIISKAVPEMSGCGLEIPDNKRFGHFSTNCAMRLAKELKRPPMAIAEEFAKRINETAPKGIFKKVEAVAPGFINCVLSDGFIQKSFKQIAKDIGKKKRQKKTIVIDYSGCNIAKPMGIGHLRSTIIGQALYNIFRFNGWKVVGDNHLGDWGKQFGVLIAAYKADNKPSKIDIEYLLKLYVDYSAKIKEDPEFDKSARVETKKLHDGDRENLRIWKKFYDASIKDFEKMYKLLGVKFDHQFGESFYNPMLAGIVTDALKKKIAQISDGAVVIPMDNAGDSAAGGSKTPFIIQKSDGAYLYTTTDLATIKYRVKKFKPDEILYVVANEQAFHFEQLFRSAKKLGLVGGQKLVHVKFGMMLSSDMKKFSTRSGKTIFLVDVINEAVNRAKKIIDEKQPGISEREKNKIAKIVGIAAVKYNDLSQNRLSDIAFDWDRMLSMEGNSAPYLQYTYARLKSILRKAKSEKSKGFDCKYLKEAEELELIVKLSNFSQVIGSITQNYFPHHLADYLYDLARTSNGYYQKVPILGANEKERHARLALVAAIAGTLKTGLELLGIETAERM